jgi:RNA polymerase sigma-70 factor (ECF subfamily)
MTPQKTLKHSQFNTEMAPHMNVMYNYALYLTSDREEANDLLQETFLKAFRFIDKFESGTNAKAWLYRIMRNTYINDYRRTKRIPDMVEYNEQLSAYQMLPRDDQQRDIGAQKPVEEIFDDAIATAIAALPEKFKSVIVLRDVQELPYEEIAEALEIPIGTVRSRLHRARGILFERLRSYATARGYAVGEQFVPGDYAIASS